MKKVTFIQAMTGFVLMAIAIGVIGGNLNPDNTPSPTMRTLDELYKNIQPGLPSDWKPFPIYVQCEQGGAINMRVEGQNQGNIQGSCTTQGKENTIIIVGLGHQVSVPVDMGSGQITGTPDTGQYYVLKYIDKSSPKLYQALCNGEHLAEVEIKFYRINSVDQEELYYTILMQDAMMVSIRTAFPNLEEIAFLPRRVKWTWEDGGIEYDYDFYSPHG